MKRFLGYKSELLLTLFFSSLSGLLFGYNTGVISGPLIFIAEQFKLTPIAQGILVGMVLLGAILGAGLAGFAADKYGRRRVILVSALLFIVGICVAAISVNFGMILVGRFITGIAVGVASLVVPIYLAEISPSALRGAFVSVNQFMVTVGILLAYVVNYLLADSKNWHLMFALGLVPALVQFAFMKFFPESPNWLLAHGKSDEARRILTHLRNDKEWESHIEAMRKTGSGKDKVSWNVLWHPHIRKLVIVGILLSIFQQITGINIIIYFTPQIFQISGYQIASVAFLASIAVGVTNVLATIGAIWFVDKIGRKTLLQAGICGMIVSLLSLSVSLMLHFEAAHIIAVLSILAYIVFFAIGLGPVTWVVLSEIYPARMRGRIMGLAVLANWGANYLVSATFPSINNTIGTGETFLVYAVISIIAFGFVHHFIPETKGQKLHDIENFIDKS